ncbi:MAG: extracellular solute-binding protein [Phycisphaerales bacterium]|nr:extracellular solute-binding protein [Phycisphaerales bacterium]
MLLPTVARAGELPDPPAPLDLRTAVGVNEFAGYGPSFLTSLEIVETFQKLHPNIRPVSSSGLQIVGAQNDMLPLMQIAGNIAPDVLGINFARSGTYITNRFLYPLDKYLENALGTDIHDGHLLSNEDYFAKLKTAPRYDEFLIGDRVPRTVWPIMRRECPYGEKCPYLEKWGAAPCAHHQHVWMFPQSLVVTAIFYRKDLFIEAELPDRAPESFEEMFEWAKKLTNPPKDRYGFAFTGGNNNGILGVNTLSLLYAYGGRLVEQDKTGEWHCVFDTENAVNAYYFIARLFLEPYDNQYGHFEGVMVEQRQGSNLKVGMNFGTIDDRLFDVSADPAQVGFGPIPMGPGGIQGASFAAGMTGIYAGLENDNYRRDAAWKYLFFLDGPESRKIRTRIYVENGVGNFISSKLLNSSGFSEFVSQIPKGWEEARDEVTERGIPEPYCDGCQSVYQYASQAIDQIKNDPVVKAAIHNLYGANDQDRMHYEEVAKNRIRVILKARVASTNERMLGIISPEERRFRSNVAVAVAVVIFVGFALLFYKVFKTFARTQVPAVSLVQPELQEPGWSLWPHRFLYRCMGFGSQAQHYSPRRGHWQFSRYKFAYIILFPALGSIALWAYYPLIRGTTITFQNYNVRGFSTWVGIDNFANVLFDPAFWYALWISVKYCLLHITFGFFTPIILAFLLTEIPRGKLIYRTLYYLPAVLSGAVVMFLWKDFYSRYGLLNQFLNLFVHAINFFGFHLAEIRIAWLENAHASLLCVILPTIWAGMGPGCLIYLAALKTIPDEYYEAAEIDGAGIWHKLWHVAIPGIKALVAINFIGAIIGTFHGGSEMVLAMTGGGPYQPYGSTEVIGLHIFWQTFGSLRFGPGAAMAWILGAMLIGFTVMRLTRLSKMEFRAAGATDAAGRK